MLVTGPNKTAQYLTDGILSIYYAIWQADAVGVFDHGLKDNELVMQELKDQKQALPKLEVLKYCKLSMLSPSLLLFGWYHWYVDSCTTLPQLLTITEVYVHIHLPFIFYAYSTLVVS